MSAGKSGDPQGAWYGRGEDRYVTRGAEVEHRPGGWYARCGKRVRGPISNLPAAMEAADAMLAAEAAAARAAADRAVMREGA